MAGESAAEVAQRLRQKAERQLEVAGQYEKGAVGERATADALAGLDSQDWVVMHDLAWPGRARANIDHVVVGPPGVFAIDTKNWSGRVELKEGHRVVRSGPYGWVRHPIYAGIVMAIAGTALVTGEATALVAPVVMLAASASKLAACTSMSRPFASPTA